MKTKIIQNIKSIVLALILVIGGSYVFASSTWVGPTATAPNNNTDTPINVGNIGQIKQGNLWIKGLTTSGGAAAYGLIVENGNVGIGTTSPTQKLDILGVTYWGDVSGKGFLGYNGNNAVVGAGGAVGGSLVLKANGKETVYISNGNVGIGTPNPTQKLDLGTTGNITANDYWINSVGKWASQLNGGALSFGGIYTMTGPSSSAACALTNPATGACSCPNGYTSQRIVVTQCSVNGDCTGGDGSKATAYYCYKS
ncbi:MAG: hypothetical protein PHT16_00360 [Candidatus Pacebacteria bacterium]|nr:hypothetical protein [Candidatus Paceibacterota bacterium]